MFRYREIRSNRELRIPQHVRYSPTAINFPLNPRSHPRNFCDFISKLMREYMSLFMLSCLEFCFFPDKQKGNSVMSDLLRSFAKSKNMYSFKFTVSKL